MPLATILGYGQSRSPPSTATTLGSRKRAYGRAAAYNSAMRAFIVVLAVIVACAVPRAGAQQPPAVRRSIPALGELSTSLQELAQRVSPCVVQIFVTGYAPPEDQQEGGAAEPAIDHSSGSGVILDADGFIVTNTHVVEHATRLEVQLRKGRIVPAQLIAADDDTDLAVIKVDASNLPTVPIGDSDALKPGQLVLAFGSPLGLESTVTMGVVSAVARQLEADDPMVYIQTDAPINPGNSGGALVDTDGRLVGINTLIYTQGGGSEGIGFAAPSNIVRNVFAQIRKDGRVRRGEIGVTPQTLTPTMADALGLDERSGVILADVDEDGPGARAGLKPGDVVLSVDGKPVENARYLRVNIFTRPIGDTVKLAVVRGADRHTVAVGIVERDQGIATLEGLSAGRRETIAPLGVTVTDVTDKVAEALGDLRAKSGAAIVAVAADAPYSAQGRLQEGDVIHSINGRGVASVADLKRLAASLKPGAAVALQIERDAGLQFIAFRVRP